MGYFFSGNDLLAAMFANSSFLCCFFWHAVVAQGDRKKQHYILAHLPVDSHIIIFLRGICLQQRHQRTKLIISQTKLRNVLPHKNPAMCQSVCSHLL